MLSAASTHLRYPNSHSNWFSAFLQYLFNASSTDEYLKEQIIRVLLEKLVAHRPHPYSVISTFVQLIKNEKFFEYEFVKKSGEEVKLLLSNIKNSLVAVSA